MMPKGTKCCQSHILCLAFFAFCLRNKADIIYKQTDSYIGVYDSSSNYTFVEAENYCITNFDTNLASIHSSSDNDESLNTRIYGNLSTWIGLSDNITDGIWKWNDGSVWDYSNWAQSGQPDGGSSANCVAILNNTSIYGANKWDDRMCNSGWHKQFICNKKSRFSNDGL